MTDIIFAVLIILAAVGMTIIALTPTSEIYERKHHHVD